MLTTGGFNCLTNVGISVSYWLLATVLLALLALLLLLVHLPSDGCASIVGDGYFGVSSLVNLLICRIDGMTSP